MKSILSRSATRACECDKVGMWRWRQAGFLGRAHHTGDELLSICLSDRCGVAIHTSSRLRNNNNDSIWMVGSSLGILVLCLVLEVVVGLLRPGIPLLWTLRRFSLASASLMITSLLLTWLSPLTRLIVVFWIWFLVVWSFLSGFVWLFLSFMLTFASGLSVLVVLVRFGPEMGYFSGCPLDMVFVVALYFPWCRALESIPGVWPQLYADNLKCVSGSPAALLSAAWFTDMYIRLVGQEAAPKKCVSRSTPKKVRNDMKGWVVSDTGDRWADKLDVRDLGGHLDSTFRSWDTALGYRIASAVPRVPSVSVLPLDFCGFVFCVRCTYDGPADSDVV